MGHRRYERPAYSVPSLLARRPPCVLVDALVAFTRKTDMFASNHPAGDTYPSAEVTGLDLSPIQPVWVPPNVKFLVDDVEDTWLNGDNIDFVHLRNMIPILKSPAKLLTDVYEYVTTYLVPSNLDGPVLGSLICRPTLGI